MMRVLHLFNGFKRLARRTQFDFVVKLQGLCDFKVYGPKEHENDKNLAPISYNRKMTTKDIINEFKPDILLLHMHEFINWIPKDFKHITEIPKVMIEVDYWSTPDIYWYKNVGLDLLINRGPYKNTTIPSVWLPMCADGKEFYVDDNIKRLNCITFTGTCNGQKMYGVRRKAVEVLGNSSIFKNDGTIKGNKYSDNLRRYIGILSGSNTYMPPAKIFEAMACGTVVLSNHINCMKSLYGSSDLYYKYKDNCSDIIKVANELVNDVDKREYIANTVLTISNEKHLDKHRIVELYNILLSLVEGREVPVTWEI